jgi:hypothetical protein
MTYLADLGNGQSLRIENVGAQTVLALMAQSAGQQQSQQMSLASGEWSTAPMLFKTPMGLILQIESSTQRVFVQIQANGIHLLRDTPLLMGAEAIPLRETSDSRSTTEFSMPSIPPMPPMEPLRMGNMEMRMDPMEMRMGDMQLRMGTSTQAKFCPQCGTRVKATDRFCSNCGTKLDR